MRAGIVFPLLLCPWASLVYSLYAFRSASRGPFLIYVFCVFANQKKKNCPKGLQHI